MTPSRSAELHDASFANREAIAQSTLVACFYCVDFWDARDVREYTADACGFCPNCRVDSLIPDATNQVGMAELLEMRRIWFDTTVAAEDVP